MARAIARAILGPIKVEAPSKSRDFGKGPFKRGPKKEIKLFYVVQKLGNEIITFLCVPEPFKSK
jgi:hypothetical protein